MQQEITKINYEEIDYFDRVEKLYELSVEDNSLRERFTNLIIVDLVTSLEVYVERTLKDFKKEYNKETPTNCIVPDLIKIEHSKKIINELGLIINHEHKNNKTKQILTEFSKLWASEGGAQVQIDFDAKYERGKHGEMQFQKLFKKIDIPDITERISLEPFQPSIIDDESIDIAGFIADITSKRNRAIHEGVPLQNSISINELEYIINSTKSLMSQINSIVNSKLDECFTH